MREDGLKAERHNLAREEDGWGNTPGKGPTNAVTTRQG